MTHIGLLGCAHIHTPGFIPFLLKRSDVKVSVVWDPENERSKVRAAELGAIVAPSPEAILADDRVKGVIVLSETDLHRQLVRASARAGKHVFVEKPLGLSGADAVAMADEIERAKVRFHTGYLSRCQREMRFIRDQIKAGNLGRITRARASVCHHGALAGWFDTDWRWMADVKRAGCGAFGDLGTHGMDLLIWWLGEVASCTAVLDNGTARYPDCEELGEAMLRFKSGAIGTLAASWDDWANPLSHLVTGTEGHIAVIQGKLHYVSRKHATFDGTQPVRESELPPGPPHVIDQFCDAVLGKPAELVSAREAAYRNVVFDACYTAAREKRWVDVHASSASAP